jgi:glycosyltransferase involved in cell wall biosynthesis
MKIFVTGTRGIPNIPGGVEKHCEELFPGIAARGHQVTLATRSCYVTDDIEEWKGVRLVKCFAPRMKSLEAILHTAIAVFKARWRGCDILHIHAIGPALLTPVAKALRLRVVFTTHGPDYDRQKWGRFAKFALRLGEKLGGLYADEVIVISEGIGGIIRSRCRREPNLIPNGVSLPDRAKDSVFLNRIGVAPNHYVLAVARFVPEKGLHDLIAAFKVLDCPFKLVIAGDADHESDYSRTLKRAASEDQRIVLTGYVTGEPLNELYSHAKLFVLPSYHEGLPIALLEAMSYGLAVLVSDILPNQEVPLRSYRFFRRGDINHLVNKLKESLDRGLPEAERKEMETQILEIYNWDKIAEQTIEVYGKVLHN